MTSDPFLAQLARLCRGADVGAKWVIVPTHVIGRTLGERLALGGVAWVNLRFVTPFTLALRTAAPHLLEERLDPLPDDLGPSLLMRLLMERPADASSYFGSLADQPRMGAALWSAIGELRLAGVSAARLPRSAFDDERKYAELRDLLASYEAHLASRRQADAADVYRAAAAHVEQSPVARGDVVVEAPVLGASAPLVRAFLDALPGQRVAAAVPRVARLDVPRRLQRVTRDEEPPLSRLAYLLAPSEAAALPGEPALELFHAAGREAEVEGVLRRILTASAAIPLDRVEIVCAAADASRLFWEKAQRLELPITVDAGIPVVATRPARALIGLCAWIDTNFSAPRLRRLLQAGEIRIEFPDGGGSGVATRLLAESKATWGRDTYGPALAAEASRFRAAAVDDDLEEDRRTSLLARADHAEFLSRWIADLLALVPVADEHDTVGLSDVVALFVEIVRDRVRAGGPLDVAAAEAIADRLKELSALGDFRCPMRQALGLVRDAVERQTVGASRPRPGHLHVSTLASAGCAGRPFTFVVGLQEGAVFPSLLEDPVLLDDERRKLAELLAADGSQAAAFPTSHDRLAESIYGVMSRLAALPLPERRGDGLVCFSYSCRDLRDGRETSPSWVMLQAGRLREGKPDLTYEQLRESLGVPETLVAPAADRALTDAGWWVSSLKAAGLAGADAVLHAFPSLAAGRMAADNRESTDFTEWDGFVPAARAVLDPRASGRPVSATRIERLVSCPFRYFLEHGLGLEPVDEEPDRDQWLDPMQRGSALHEMFAALGREARDNGRRLSPARDGDRARDIAEARLSALRAQFPPPSELVFDRECADFLHDVDLFLQFEAERPASEPVAFEVAFGHDDGSGEPLARAEPVTIELGTGESFRLRGTIDRIDRLPDGSYEVIDYKTGKYDPPKWGGTFRGGAMLQHALYGLAASHLLRRVESKPRIARGVYEFPSARGGGGRKRVEPPDHTALAAVLSDLFDVMAQGAFVSTTDEHECEFCDYPRACGKPVAQAAAKLENDDNEVLEPCRRLVNHE